MSQNGKLLNITKAMIKQCK